MGLYGGVELVGRPDLENVMKLDLLPQRSIREMMSRGFAIDVDYMRELDSELGKEMEVLRREICDLIPAEKLDEFMARAGLEDDDREINLDSNEQLSDLLFEVLRIGEGRQLKTTKSGKRLKTDKKQLEQFKNTHVIVAKTLTYKEYAKQKSTYTGPLPLIARHDPRTDSYRIHTELMSTRTGTGRFASKKPNLQNISARSALGKRVRKGFVASPGMEIVAADFSQAEMRLGGHYSKDANLLRIFHNDLDPHTDTAKRAFNTETPDKLTQRDPCKNVNFGVFYGLGKDGLYDLMSLTYATAKMELPEWLTVEWCDQFIKDWFELYPEVKGYLEKQHYRARRYGCVWSLMGRIRRVPEVRSCHKRVVGAGLRQAGNMPIQATCADWMKLAIAEIQAEVIEKFRAEGVECWPLMTVHDEMLVEVEEGYGDVLKTHMETIMSQVMTDKQTGEELCLVPVKADGKVMRRWEK